MSKKTGSAKTRKAVAKRFKVTGSGKIKRFRQGKGHLLESKNRKRKRRLRTGTLVSEVDAPSVHRNLPFS